jgi:hypothetical protein
MLLLAAAAAVLPMYQLLLLQWRQPALLLWRQVGQQLECQLAPSQNFALHGQQQQLSDLHTSSGLQVNGITSSCLHTSLRRHCTTHNKQHVESRCKLHLQE